jgi:hypothetical protein
MPAPLRCRAEISGAARRSPAQRRIVHECVRPVLSAGLHAPEGRRIIGAAAARDLAAGVGLGPRTEDEQEGGDDERGRVPDHEHGQRGQQRGADHHAAHGNACARRRPHGAGTACAPRCQRRGHACGTAGRQRRAARRAEVTSARGLTRKARLTSQAHGTAHGQGAPRSLCARRRRALPR